MSEAMMIALVGAGAGMCSAIIPKLIDNHYGIGKDIKEIKNDVQEMKKDTSMNSDMIYQVLDHLATKNNSGEMNRALKDYNSYFRHKEDKK